MQTILGRVTQEGMRPEFPPNSPAQYVTLAQRCWNQDPAARPTFGEVTAELKAMQEAGIRPPEVLAPAALVGRLSRPASRDAIMVGGGVGAVYPGPMYHLQQQQIHNSQQQHPQYQQHQYQYQHQMQQMQQQQQPPQHQQQHLQKINSPPNQLRPVSAAEYFEGAPLPQGLKLTHNVSASPGARSNFGDVLQRRFPSGSLSPGLSQVAESVSGGGSAEGRVAFREVSEAGQRAAFGLPLVNMRGTGSWRERRFPSAPNDAGGGMTAQIRTLVSIQDDQIDHQVVEAGAMPLGEAVHDLPAILPS